MKDCSNKRECSCSYSDCARHGKCCKCVAYHRRLNEVPGCYFPADIERTGERSIRKLTELNKK